VPNVVDTEQILGRHAATHRVLAVLFSCAVFWSSALLFVLEPMFAKMILPMFGGSPAVWNASIHHPTFFAGQIFKRRFTGAAFQG